MQFVSTIKRKFKTVLNRPQSVLVKLLLSLSPLLDDKSYLKLLFPLKVGYRLNLNNPKTYNEKLQWLKINFKNPILNKMVDKYEAKILAAEIIGEEYIIKNYGVWNSFEEIDFEKLPRQFVLKTTHDQGGVVVVKDKDTFNKEKAQIKLNKHLARNQYYLSREWPYKNVKPRILAEAYMEEGNSGELKDYKFFCFNGTVKTMFLASERQSGDEVKFDFYDRDFKHLDIVQTHPNSGKNFDVPDNFEVMIKLSERLSIGFPSIRIDLYNIDGQIYFGEFTFFHHGGLVAFHPEKWDDIFGSWIDLELVKTANIDLLENKG